jgi:DNA mismatch repair protein MutL
MNRIRLLSEQVANQIAAGEVVERPASVVKELVENAIDADARRITVEIQAGGRGLIRVTDDGVGMSEDDALLSLERHATSKIRHAEDLHAIATMGFRGEALPSLASVSRMSLTTREREPATPFATQVIIHGGKILEVKEAGAPVGTSIEARQLFYNLPARRKFLRSEETEKAHIQHYLTLAALGYPAVAFAFISDSRTLWQLPPAEARGATGKPLSALRERLRSLYGSADGMLPVDFASTLDVNRLTRDPDTGEQSAAVAIHIWGFIGAPGLSRATRENQHLFVNRRPVENRGLNHALLEGYHTTLMKGRFPVTCLFIEIDPAEVDVNIHPAKKEVKFRHENAVRQQVGEAVRQTLREYHRQTTAGYAPAPPPFEAPENPAKNAPVAAPHQPPSSPVDTALPLFPEPSAPAIPSAPAGHSEAAAAPLPPITVDAVAPGAETAPTAAAPVLAAPPRAPESVPPSPPLLAVPLRIIGVLGRLYVVLESDRGLVLLDQHAAHERVLYEQMLSRLETGQVVSQRLLLAETIEVSTRDAQFLREQAPILARLGVGLNEFGERTFLLDALPPFVQAPDARTFVLALVDELKATGQTVNSWRLGEQVIAKTVCRHAVKAHDPLTSVELEKLLQDLRRCVMPYTCPHGRPTLIEMNFRELEKRFGRVV